MGKLVLKNKRIRWNSPLNFNDPFDCHFPMGFNFHLSDYRDVAIARVLGAILGITEPTFDLSNPLGVAHALLREMRSELDHDEIRREMTAGIDESIATFSNGFEAEAARWQQQLPRQRLLCVCETVENLLLWSHYAEQHRGIVFRFDCIKELDVPLLAANPVVYSKEAPTIASAEEWIDVLAGLQALPKAEKHFQQVLNTKSDVWSQELEWRVTSWARPGETGLFSDYPFDPREISRAYLGCKMAEADKLEILALAKSNFAHVEFYQAIQSKRAYSLTFSRIQ